MEKNIQNNRVIWRMKELMPLKDKIKKEQEYINENVEWSSFTTFILSRPVWKEVVFYYLLHFNHVDHVKVFTAEAVKDIYMNKHPEYSSIHDVHAPYIVVVLGGELYNRQMINILNIFSDAVSSSGSFKGFIYVYCGTEKEFANIYCNQQERGLLKIGTRIVVCSDKPKRVGRKPKSESTVTIQQINSDSSVSVADF